MICELIGLAMQGGFAMIYAIGLKLAIKYKKKKV